MRVVVLGGGYTAIWCYRALRRWMGDSVSITVVSPATEQVFHGWTAEVLDGGLAPELQTSSLAECVPKAELLQGRAVAVDAERREVVVEVPGGAVTVDYDELVVATGAHDRTSDVPGLAEHSWSLRFHGAVPALLEHLAAVDARVRATAADVERDRTIVVVGAGFAGTEVAAALGRRYGSLRRIVLVSSTATVVPMWQGRARLQQRLTRNIEAAGVELVANVRVVAVDADGVRLSDGSRIAAATVVSALGNVVPAVPGLERFQGDGGLFGVDEFLRVTDGVWAAGDVAAVRTRTGFAPKEALWAIRAGTTVGRNIARTARGARPRRFGFRGLGTVAAFAPGRAVALFMGVPLPEVMGWLVRVVFFLWYVPSRRTAARILHWSLVGSRRVPPAPAPVLIGMPEPVLVEAPAERPALVGLDGGRMSADRLRPAAGAGAEQERRRAGA